MNMRIVIRLVIITVFFITLLLAAKVAFASEGTVELSSTSSEPYRCFVVSIRMKSLEYKIPFSCRNLIYPADENIFNYIMWATPEEGGNPVKLGALALGKGEFKTKTTFSDLFVTIERSAGTKTPTGRVVMRGDLLPIEFLEEVTTPTPTPEEEAEEEISPGDEGGEELEEPQEELTTRQKFVLALRRAGIAALFALIALIGLIFVITRSRG
jgi:hypothetical protein